MDFPPWLKVKHSPSLFLGIMPLLNLVAVNIAGWVPLIKMHIYMMPQFNTCHMSRYTIGDNSNPKHNITKSMVGPFPLAPHHDYLQYMYHVYLRPTRSKPGCYIIQILQLVAAAGSRKL